MLDTETASRRHSGAGTKVALSSASAAKRQDSRDDPAPVPRPEVQSHESRMNRIARRAHEIYEARGGEHGKAMEDWLQAEREIDTELDASHPNPVE